MICGYIYDLGSNSEESLDSFFMCAFSEDSSAALFTNVASSQQMPNALADGEKRTTALPSSPLPPRPVSVVANAAFFANEHCQNSLDRKPTQNDSGELQNVSLDPTAVTAATRSPIGTEEDYEPSMVPDTIQPSISDHSAENTIQEEQLRETGSLPTVEGIFSHTNHPPMQSLELDMVDNDSGDIDPHEMGSGSDRSLPIADPNDSDDYEPPEPSFAVEPSTLPSDVVIDEKISLSPSSTRDLKPLSEPMDTSLALPVNDERSVVTAESASPDQPTVRFFFTHLIYLIFLPGHRRACKPRNKLLRALRKPAEKV